MITQINNLYQNEKFRLAGGVNEYIVKFSCGYFDAPALVCRTAPPSLSKIWKVSPFLKVEKN